MAIESGYAVALMVPTEILAGQHYATFQRWLDPLGIPVHLQTANRKTLRPSHTDPGGNPNGSTANPDRQASAAALVIGTHALIERAFALDRLGLVIIDEQHKFGVAQRERLVRKGSYPHLLVMTATPIPRTLGLTLYGDLDLSVIDALPAGRGQVKTYVRASDRLPKVWAFVRDQIAAGRQAYVVYPRIEESDDDDLKTVIAGHRRLRRELAPHRVEMLHGQLAADEKESVMNGFRSGQIQVLVATSVIEVGVDVPNATVMVIENADHFGLAQLHQLRGRIGRGAHLSHCILVADRQSTDARRRLTVLERSHDGFRIAEEDLLLRGPGELLGREQSGLPPFRFADLARDLPLVERARAVALEILLA
jgi:ATP-dependent DNA helicase RecG